MRKVDDVQVLRVEKLLRGTDLKLKEIAEMTGISATTVKRINADLDIRRYSSRSVYTVKFLTGERMGADHV